MISCCLNRDRYVRKVRQREAKDALWCEIEFKNSRRPKFVHLHAHWACIHNCLFVTAAVFLSGLFNKHQNPTGASWQRQINFLRAQIVSLSLSVGTAPLLSENSWGRSLQSPLCLHHQITNHITNAVILRRTACLHFIRLVCSIFSCHDLWRSLSRKMMIHKSYRRSERSVSRWLVIIGCGRVCNWEQASFSLKWPDDSIQSIIWQNDNVKISCCF